MSRIGKKEISIPPDTTVIINDSSITVKGKKGKIEYTIPDLLLVEQIQNQIIIKKKCNNKKAKALHGLSRSIINNMIVGVSEGFEKKLVIQGVGYRSQMNGKTLVINVGYSHPVEMNPPSDINIKVENNTNITISGISKEKVGQTAATIRSIRPPEPYKGKGIRYENEIVRRKVGKAGK